MRFLEELLEPDDKQFLENLHELYMAKDHYRGNPMKDSYTPVYHLYELPVEQSKPDCFYASEYM